MNTPTLNSVGINETDFDSVDFTVKKGRIKTKKLTKEKARKFSDVVNLPEDLGNWAELASECDITPEDAEKLYFEVKNAIKQKRIDKFNLNK